MKDKMASKEQSISHLDCREILQSFSLSETETSVEQNLHCAYAWHDSQIHQRVAAEDDPEMTPCT